jgi:hypothetical protein
VVEIFEMGIQAAMRKSCRGKLSAVERDVVDRRVVREDAEFARRLELLVFVEDVPGGLGLQGAGVYLDLPVDLPSRPGREGWRAGPGSAQSVPEPPLMGR